MLIYFLILSRIFSEQLPGLSALIAALIILLFVVTFLHGASRRLRTDYFLIQFLLVYFSVNAAWGLLSLYNFGWIVGKPIVYDLLKPFALVCFFWILSNNVLIRAEKLGRLLATFVGVYAVIGYYSALSVATGAVFRASWPSSHHNYIGVTFAILIAYILLSNHSVLFRLFTGAGLFLGLGATRSLSSLILLTITFLIYFCYKRNFLRLLFVGGFLVCFFYFAGELFLQDRLTELTANIQDFAFTWETQPIRSYGESSKWRIVNWSILYDLFEERFALGWGTLSYMIINPLRATRGMLGGYHPHSEFFSWLVSFGLIGSVILGGSLLYFSIKEFCKNRNMVVANSLALGCTVGTMLGSGFLYYPMMLFVIMLACHHLHLSERKTDDQAPE